MNRTHRVHMHESGTYLGAGFLLTRGFVLTALHCLRGASADDAVLTLELPDGRSVPARRCDAVAEPDLARGSRLRRGTCGSQRACRTA